MLKQFDVGKLFILNKIENMLDSLHLIFRRFEFFASKKLRCDEVSSFSLLRASRFSIFYFMEETKSCQCRFWFFFLAKFHLWIFHGLWVVNFVAIGNVPWCPWGWHWYWSWHGTCLRLRLRRWWWFRFDRAQLFAWLWWTLWACCIWLWNMANCCCMQINNTLLTRITFGSRAF